MMNHPSMQSSTSPNYSGDNNYHNNAQYNNQDHHHHHHHHHNMPKQVSSHQQPPRRRSSCHSINSTTQMTMETSTTMSNTIASSISASPETLTDTTTLGPNTNNLTSTTTGILQDVPEGGTVLDNSNWASTIQQQQQLRSSFSNSGHSNNRRPQRSESISAMSLAVPSNHHHHQNQQSRTSLTSSSMSFRFGQTSSHHNQFQNSNHNSSLGSSRLMITLNESYASFAQPPPFANSSHDDLVTPVTTTELPEQQHPEVASSGNKKVINRRPSIFTSYSGKNYVIDDTTNGEPIPMLQQQSPSFRMPLPLSFQSQPQPQPHPYSHPHPHPHHGIETNSLAYPTDDSTNDQVSSSLGANSSHHIQQQQQRNNLRRSIDSGPTCYASPTKCNLDTGGGNSTMKSPYQHQQQQDESVVHNHQPRRNSSGGNSNMLPPHQQLRRATMASPIKTAQQQIQQKVLLSFKNLDRIPPPLPQLPLCNSVEINKQQHCMEYVSAPSKRCLDSNYSKNFSATLLNEKLQQTLTETTITNGVPFGISISAITTANPIPVSLLQTYRHCYIMVCQTPCQNKMMVSKYCTIVQCPECHLYQPAQASIK